MARSDCIHEFELCPPQFVCGNCLLIAPVPPPPKPSSPESSTHPEATPAAAEQSGEQPSEPLQAEVQDDESEAASAQPTTNPSTSASREQSELPPAPRLYDRVYCGAAVPPDYVAAFKRLVKIGGRAIMPVNDQVCAMGWGGDRHVA